MASSSLCFHRRCPSCVGSEICQKIERSASQLRWLVDSVLEKLQSRLASLLSSFRFRLLGLDAIRNGCLCRSFLLLFLYPVRPYFSFSGFYLHSISYESHALVGFQEFNHCHFIYACWRISDYGFFFFFFFFKELKLFNFIFLWCNWFVGGLLHWSWSILRYVKHYKFITSLYVCCCISCMKDFH